MTSAEKYKREHPSKRCIYARDTQWSSGCVAMIGFDVCGVHATPEQRAERRTQKLAIEATDARARRRQDAARIVAETNSKRAQRLAIVDRLLVLALEMVKTPCPGSFFSDDQFWVAQEPDWSVSALADAIHDDLGWDVGVAKKRLRDVLYPSTSDIVQ